MKYSNPMNLGIIACPGGESFADEVIAHIEGLYLESNRRVADELSARYGLATEEVIERINFISDIVSLGPYVRSEKGRCPVPSLKTRAQFTCFANGEVKAEILESIRGKDVYVFQDVENRFPVRFGGCEDGRAFSINDHLMMLLVTIDAAHQSGAKRITVVTPNYPYARQHKAKGREGLTASRIGKLFESLGVSRTITLDIHSRDIMNSFTSMRLENLHASYEIIKALSDIEGILDDDFVVVSPDTGAVDRNKFFASALKKPLALLYKERDYSKVGKNAGESNISQLRLLGDVSGKTVFMADDLLGTGGTLIKGMELLKENGARKIICSISLPLFSGDAVSYFDRAHAEGLFDRIIGTNAVYQKDVLTREWYTSVDISRLFAEVIQRLHGELSVSDILDNRGSITGLLDTQRDLPQREFPFA